MHFDQTDNFFSYKFSNEIVKFIYMFSSTAPAANLATAPRVMSKKYKWELDTQTMLANSNFKINPSELIKRCKEVCL